MPSGHEMDGKKKNSSVQLQHDLSPEAQKGRRIAWMKTTG
jgi:hypothetical protein